MLFDSHSMSEQRTPSKTDALLPSWHSPVAPSSSGTTQSDTPENYTGKPMWVKNQRNSWHGVDFPYHSDLDVKEYYIIHCRTLSAVDDSVIRPKAVLDQP